MRFLRSLLTALALIAVILLPGCIKDQQAARTRLPGVDKPPEKHETEKKPEVVEEEPEEEKAGG
jgi:hypothetical protein